MLFWLVFAIFIFGLFIFNREAISNGIQTVQNEIAARKTGEPPIQVPEVSPAPSLPERQNPVPLPSSPPVRQLPPATQAAPAPPPKAVTPAAVPADKSPAQPAAQPAAPPTTQPASLPAAQTPPPAAAPQAAQESRERVLYFIQVDRGGSIFRIKVNRKLPVSDSPMTDAIQALIGGPNAEEKSKGLISLIPPNTRILSSTVRGNTAYISFSEDFQYNTYGVEGYAGQIRQIVFTATEFSNVMDVQILIEGRRLDYLGEGIWIGSPLNREML